MNKILDADSLYMARMVRQIPIFGIEGQKRIAETPVAIVGCGGNGSLMALVCALVGFLVIYLFDPDKWEIHNLNRSMLAGVRDIGKLKAAVVKRKLKSLFPEIQIKAYTQDIRAPGMWGYARECGWVLEACDNDETRGYLQQKCSEDNVQMISVASGFSMRGDCVVHAGCRANRAGHGDGCLRCQALADGPTDHAHISLVVPNMIAVALGVDFLLRELTSYDKSAADNSGEVLNDIETSVDNQNNNSIHFDLFSRTLISERVIPSPHCPCGSNSGK